MRGSSVIFIGLFLWLSPAFLCAGQIDSTRLAALDVRLENYFRTLEPERIEVKNRECDLLIESAKDSLLRRHIALKIYDHYLESPVMGDEAVAIHLTDKWFAPGLIDMGGDGVLLDARVYADFNRQSLLGMQAPSAVLETPGGEKVEVGGSAARYRVLFFYDTECSKCKLETVLLRAKLNSKNWPIDVYAIYTGHDALSWKEWRETKFAVRAPKTSVLHLWDPEVGSDYQIKYGVIQTPRMFLLDRSGVIIGRGMDTRALELLLGLVLSDAPYEYGSVSSSALMDNLFASYEEPVSEPMPPTPGERLSSGRRNRLSGRRTWTSNLSERPDTTRILSMAKALEERTLTKGDTAFFKHLEGDLLYWLTSRRDELSKEGAIPFINEYILSRPGIWNTQDDTLKVVGLARMMKDLLSRTPVGSRLPKAKALVPESPRADSGLPKAEDLVPESPRADSGLPKAEDLVPESPRADSGLPKAEDLVPESPRAGGQSYGPAQEICSQKPKDAAEPISGIVSAGTSAFSLRGWKKNWDRLRRKGGFIVFHTEGCPVCKAEIAAADSLGLRTLDVNVDEVAASAPGLAKALLDTFDLSSMPFILDVDRHGVIRRRYISFLPGL